jgi:hypothetical protein
MSSATPPADPLHPAAAVADLTGIGQWGLSVRYFLTNNPTATPNQVLATGSLTYGPGNPLPSPTGTATSIAALWIGYLSTPQDGNYNLRFTVNTGATVTEVKINGQSVPMTQTTTAAGAVWANQNAITLQSGTLNPIRITATGLATGSASSFSAAWETLGTGRRSPRKTSTPTSSSATCGQLCCVSSRRQRWPATSRSPPRT